MAGLLHNKGRDVWCSHNFLPLWCTRFAALTTCELTLCVLVHSTISVAAPSVPSTSGVGPNDYMSGI